MAEIIQNIDTWLFRLCNRGIANPLFDVIMPFITNSDNWILLFILVFVYLFMKGGRKGIICGVTLIIAIIISDQLSSSVLKEMFGRVRPCSSLHDVRLLVGCGAGKSFPSSHAVNVFNSFVILSYYYREYKWHFFTVAAAIAFSRVYVGVHYPFDIIGGAIIGAAIGGIMVSIPIIAEKLYLKVNNHKRHGKSDI